MHTSLVVMAVIALVGLVGSCSTESVGRPPTPPVNWAGLEPRPAPLDAGKLSATAKERAAADAYTSALGSPDFAQLGAALDEDVHFAFAGYKDVHGRENAVKAHEALLGGLESRRLVTTRLLLTDSSQVVEWTMTAVQKATKKSVAFRGLSLLWTKDDGAISDVHLYYDEAVLKAQLGVGPKALSSLAPPAAPSAPRQEVEQAGAPEEVANLAVARGALEALENNDEPAYLAAMTDDVEVTGLESAQPLRGKAGARAYMKTMRTAIGNLDTQMENGWSSGPFVTLEYRIVGEQRGPIGWVPAQKDTLLKMYIVDVIEMRGGKIARVWRYDNIAQIVASSERGPQ